jgi:hypothetical protein
MPTKGAATLLATRSCPGGGTGIVAPALLPVPVPPTAGAVTVEPAVGVAPVIVPALLVFAFPAVVIPAGAASPAVDVKLTPVNDIAAIITHSCFARSFMV